MQTTSAGSIPAKATVLLTDHPWEDLQIENAIFAAAGITLVAGPVVAGDSAAVEALVEATDPAAILTCWAPVSAKAIALPSRLRIVARMGIGLDNIATEDASRRGAWVTNVPDYCVGEVSDHAIGLLLAHCRGIVELDNAAKRGLWNPSGVRLRRVADLSVGIIGLGRIGRETARKLRALGCRVLACDPAADMASLDVTPASMAEIATQCDVIVLHVPLLPTTHHLVDDAFVASCKRRPFLINVSRGGLVDNEALLRGLSSGQLGGAALDVVDGEPSPAQAILTNPQIIVTPHVSFLSDASLIELRTRACDNVVRALGGGSPLHICAGPR